MFHAIWFFVSIVAFAIEVRFGKMSFWMLATAKRGVVAQVENALVVAAVISIMPIVLFFQWVQYEESVC